MTYTLKTIDQIDPEVIDSFLYTMHLTGLRKDAGLCDIQDNYELDWDIIEYLTDLFTQEGPHALIHLKTLITK